MPKKVKYDLVELYGGEIRIRFYPNNHAYWLETEEIKKDGETKLKRLCGVTTYCGMLNKPFLIPWAVNTTVEFIKERIDLINSASGNQILEMARREADLQKNIAADIGKAIHLWIEQHIKGELPAMPEDPQVIEGVNNFIDWVNQNDVKFIWSERIVYSKKHGFVGTADIGIEMGGENYLLDIKTGNSLYEEVKMQTAAYLIAESEESGIKYKGRYALRISKETKEEYMERMEKKNARYVKPREIPPFKVFEAIYLDEDEDALARDMNGFRATMEIKSWKDYATKELNQLKSD